MAFHPRPIILLSQSFSYKSKTFSAFLSDFGRTTPWGMIYDDAIDQGFMLRSERTGDCKAFRQVEIQKNGEGDVEAYIFEPCNNALRTEGVKVIFYND